MGQVLELMKLEEEPHMINGQGYADKGCRGYISRQLLVVASMIHAQSNLIVYMFQPEYFIHQLRHKAKS